MQSEGRMQKGFLVLLKEETFSPWYVQRFTSTLLQTSFKFQGKDTCIYIVIYYNT